MYEFDIPVIKFNYKCKTDKFEAGTNKCGDNENTSSDTDNYISSNKISVGTPKRVQMGYKGQFDVKDASGHEHDDLGRFTGPGRSGSANGKGNKTSRSKKPPMSKPAENTGIKAEHTGSKSSYVSSDGKTEFHVEQKDGKRILTSAKLGRPDDVENIITQLAEKGPVSISLEMKRRYDNLSSALVNAKFRTKKIELDHSTDGTTTISMKAAKKPHQQRKERHTAVDLGDLPKEFLGRKLSVDEVVALRYSSNIERDIDRGYSFGEIGASPCETEEEAWEEWPGAHDIVYSEELGGYMLTEPGLSLLSAEWGETVEQAIPAAVENAATYVAGGTYGAAEVPLYILIGKPGEFDSNGYPTMKRVTDYHRIKPPWKKK